MKECRQCYQLKPLSDFYADASYRDGHKARCKQCETARHRQKRSIGVAEHSIEDQRRIAYLQKLYKRFDGQNELVIPVIALNHTHPAKRACVVRPMADKNRILISSLKGLREYEFELVSPQALLDILKELQLQVYLP